MKPSYINRLLVGLSFFCLLNNCQAQYQPAPYEKDIKFYPVETNFIFSFKKIEGGKPVKLAKKHKVIENKEIGQRGVKSVKILEFKTNKKLYEVKIPTLNKINPSKYGTGKEKRVTEVHPLDNQDLLLAGASGHMRYFYSKKENKFSMLPMYHIRNGKSYYSYSWSPISDHLLMTVVYLNRDPETSGSPLYSNNYIVYDINTKKLYTVELAEEFSKHSSIEIRYPNEAPSVVEVIPYIAPEEEGEAEYLESLGFYKMVKKKEH